MACAYFWTLFAGENFLSLNAARLKREFGMATFGGRNRVLMFVKLLR